MCIQLIYINKGSLLAEVLHIFQLYHSEYITVTLFTSIIFTGTPLLPGCMYPQY